MPSVFDCLSDFTKPGLLLGTETPVMTPSGADGFSPFRFSKYFKELGAS